jgi:hypothetical protein
VRRCLAQLLIREPLLELSDASLLADDMGGERHHRQMLPEAAADTLFLPVKPMT